MASPRNSHGGGYIPGNISPSSSNATQASNSVSSLAHINPTSTKCIAYLNQRHGGGYIPRRPVQSVQRNLSGPPRSIETPPNPRNGYYPAVQEQQQPQTNCQTSYGASSPSASHYPANHSQPSVQSPYNSDYVAYANYQSMPPPGQPVPYQQSGNQGMPIFSSQTVSHPL
jgi:hypothetical protein